MELENLKESWKQTEHKSFTPAEIRKIIGQQSKLPLHRLKRRFRKALVIVPVALSYIILTFPKKYDLSRDPLFWSYVLICASVVVFAIINYIKIGRLEKMDEPVYDHLINEVNAIEKSVRIQRRSISIVLVLFMVFIEVMTYFKAEAYLIKWSHVFWYYRLLYYAGFFILREILSRLIFRYRFQNHIESLREIARQMK